MNKWLIDRYITLLLLTKTIKLDLIFFLLIEKKNEIK